MEDKKLVDGIIESIDKVPYGQVSITVYRHSNKTVNFVMHEFENQLFSNNVDFMQWVIQGLKNIASKKQSGEILLKITAKEGLFRKITEERKFEI